MYSTYDKLEHIDRFIQKTILPNHILYIEQNHNLIFDNITFGQNESSHIFPYLFSILNELFQIFHIVQNPFRYSYLLLSKSLFRTIRPIV